MSIDYNTIDFEKLIKQLEKEESLIYSRIIGIIEDELGYYDFDAWDVFRFLKHEMKVIQQVGKTIFYIIHS